MSSDVAKLNMNMANGIRDGRRRPISLNRVAFLQRSFLLCRKPLLRRLLSGIHKTWLKSPHILWSGSALIWSSGLLGGKGSLYLAEAIGCPNFRHPPKQIG